MFSGKNLDSSTDVSSCKFWTCQWDKVGLVLSVYYFSISLVLLFLWYMSIRQLGFTKGRNRSWNIFTVRERWIEFILSTLPKSIWHSGHFWFMSNFGCQPETQAQVSKLGSGHKQNWTSAVQATTKLNCSFLRINRQNFYSMIALAAFPRQRLK